MKQFILKNKKTLGGILAIIFIGGITMSFQDSPFGPSKFDVQEDFYLQELTTDTVPEKECNGSIKMKDLDKIQGQLDKTLLQVSEEMKNINFDKIQSEIQASLKNLDMEKIMKDVENALKSIDVNKIVADVASSLKDINWDDKSKEMEMALGEARKELEKASLEIKNIDKEAIEKELGKAKLEIEKTKLNFDKIDIDKIMAEAKAGINKAKEELALTKEMLTEMEKDGLVNSKEGFTIEYKDKYLYIDGKKQSEKTTDKYRKYFKKDHFKITIEKE